MPRPNTILEKWTFVLSMRNKACHNNRAAITISINSIYIGLINFVSTLATTNSINIANWSDTKTSAIFKSTLALLKSNQNEHLSS